jgi:hypothetical protein
MPGRLARHRVAEAVGSRHYADWGAGKIFTDLLGVAAAVGLPPAPPPWHPPGIDRNLAALSQLEPLADNGMEIWAQA